MKPEQITFVYVDASQNCWQHSTEWTACSLQQAVEQFLSENGWPVSVLNELNQCAIGIWGQLIELPQAHLPQPGDRIEWYRPLIYDPKQRRLERSASFVRANQRRRV